MIQKLRIFWAYIEAFVDRWGQYLVDDLENGRQADAENVGRLFEVR